VDLQSPKGGRTSRDSLLAVGIATIAIALALKGASSVEFFIRDWGRHFGSYGGEFMRILVGEGLTALGFLNQASALAVIAWALTVGSPKRNRRIGQALAAGSLSFLLFASATAVFSWDLVQHRYLHVGGTGELASFVSALILAAAGALAAMAFLRATGRSGNQPMLDSRLARATTVAAIGFALAFISSGLLAGAYSDPSTYLPDSYVASLWILTGGAAVLTAGSIIASRGFSASDREEPRDHLLGIAALALSGGYLVDGVAGIVRKAGLGSDGWWDAAAGWVQAGHYFVVSFGLCLVAVAFFRTSRVVAPGDA
jgi:hypothetical protein